ncbi:hypothetical protein HHI36_020881 [Cryptolaemus montrouzieri]|uniref:C2H2-type domain-containing protein n=1 Tax=Cryptolaemus montrouzieri TaxID=559131 RepID=A0ABD2NCE9_9CUCU
MINPGCTPDLEGKFDNCVDSRSELYQKCLYENIYSENNYSNINPGNNKEYEIPNSYYEYCEDYSGLNNYLGLSSTSLVNASEFDALGQQSDGSNEESDIIVEESDEEITDFSEDHEKKINHIYKCVVCNTMRTVVGVQFYFLTSISPVTMTSQQPVFSKLKNLIGAIRTKHNYICSECLGLLNSIDHFQSKLTDFKNELLSKFKTTCSAIGQYPIRNHRKVRRELSYRCKFCCKILSLKSYYRFHVIKHHKQKLLCEKCGTFCGSVKKFHKHTCSYSKLVLQPFACSNCRRIFRTKSKLQEHQNFCLGILPFICKTGSCGKKFTTATKLKNHIKLKHDKKFVAICSICNIGFVKMSDYKSHKTSHSTDKKFQCQKCDNSYKTLSNLNFHLKSHQKKLPFLCNICGKGFMRKEYLETHTNNHNNIKNFVCSICSKRFSSEKLGFSF